MLTRGVSVEEDPTLNVSETEQDGEHEKYEKFGSVDQDSTVRVSDCVEVIVRPSPVAMILIEVLPGLVLMAAMNATVTVHVGLHGLFVNWAVMPEGNADVKNVMGWVAPPVNVAVIDDEPLVEPGMTLRVVGEGEESVKPNP